MRLRIDCVLLGESERFSDNGCLSDIWQMLIHREWYRLNIEQANGISGGVSKTVMNMPRSLQDS